MQNEPLRRRLLELHGIYLTPSPSDEMAREVRPPEFAFLPGVEPHVKTDVEVVVKANRGRKFYRIHTFTVDPDRVAAAVEAIGTDVVLDLVVVEAEIVEHLGDVPVWRVRGFDGGTYGNQLPKISTTYMSRASDNMIVTSWDLKGIRSRLRNYENAPKPLDWLSAEFARLNGIFDGEGFTITGISVLSRPDEKKCANPEKKRICYCISGRRRVAIRLTDRRHGRVLEHDVERTRPFTKTFWWAGDDRFVAVGCSGRPNPDEYAKWKTDQARRKAEAERKAELAGRTADDDLEDAAIADVLW